MWEPMQFKNMYPHFLYLSRPFLSAQHTGKTTSVLCLAREMLGSVFGDAVLEMNASDARGIDVVRNKIKMFAQQKVTLPPGRHKIIILDEADSMTSSAQQALRRTMELYSNTTRFALACNTSSKLIEPIQSRCAILRFTRLDDKEVLKRVKEVIEIEKIEQYTTDGLEAILFTAQGDLRNALNNLQATYAGMGSITPEHVFKVIVSETDYTYLHLHIHQWICEFATLNAHMIHLSLFVGTFFSSQDQPHPIVSHTSMSGMCAFNLFVPS
jgi:DNA polymerase III delta prime subunit